MTDYQHQTTNMADAAAARREARRRRILENSHNRLQFISGKHGDDCPKESSKKFPIPDQNIEDFIAPETSSSFLFSSSSSLDNGVLVTEPETREGLSPNQDFVAAGDGEIARDLPFLGPPTLETVPPKALWERFIIYKYDIAILSLIMQLLHSWSPFTFDNAYFFLPLIVYIVTKLIWFPTESKSYIASVFLLMNGISGERADYIMNIIQWFVVIAQDISVYLFTTVCVQSICNLYKDNLVT